ncbi:MAG: pyrroline-5-carboxylate reductase [Anaerolineae bacterium]|nr:pyrroline-5-carboxylate reductase [Anaerolineae bacterium]
MPLQNTTVAFIGSGVMGEAMIKGLLNQQLVNSQQIIASDPHPERLQQLEAAYQIKTTLSNSEAGMQADLLVLSVKPQVLDKVLSELRGQVTAAPLVLSIIAGAQIESIAAGLDNARVVRSMPNTPGQIGQGITVWTASAEVAPEQRAQAQALLGALGDEMYVEDERYLDMATALSGTGPAYTFMFMEAMIDAGVHMGFSRRDAERLVIQTMRGSVEYAIESKLHPAQLRNQVTSPGGTSAAAIYEMEKGRIRTVIADAVWAAYRRAEALGKPK